MAKNPRLIDISGKRFGMWTVGTQTGNTKGGGALWACKCDCGTIRIVLGSDLRNGKSAGCGCTSVGRLGDLQRTHGDTGTRLYETWKGMHARCRGADDKSVKNYSSRGIIVCDDWSEFAVFRAWAMSSGYADDLTIERIDVDGNYEPSNCTWIPKGEQAYNRRIVSRAPDGELWWHKAKKNGISCAAFRQRVFADWPPEQASTWPMNTLRQPRSRDAEGRFA